MAKLVLAAQIISAVSFLWYGASCLFSKHMVTEFQRYRLSPWRKLTGILQLLGSLGLIIGFYHPGIAMISGLGLAIMMLFGIMARIRIHDSLIQTLPAVIYFCLNLFLVIALRTI